MYLTLYRVRGVPRFGHGPVVVEPEAGSLGKYLLLFVIVVVVVVLVVVVVVAVLVVLVVVVTVVVQE